MKLYLLYPASEHLLMSNSINSCLAAGADISAARLAVLEADKPKGFIDKDKFQAWSSLEVADGTVTLPDGSAVQWFGKAYAPALPMVGT